MAHTLPDQRLLNEIVQKTSDTKIQTFQLNERKIEIQKSKKLSKHIKCLKKQLKNLYKTAKDLNKVLERLDKAERLGGETKELSKVLKQNIREITLQAELMKSQIDHEKSEAERIRNKYRFSFSNLFYCFCMRKKKYKNNINEPLINKEIRITSSNPYTLGTKSIRLPNPVGSSSYFKKYQKNQKDQKTWHTLNKWVRYL